MPVDQSREVHMNADVKVTEGGQMVKTENMKLKMVKAFSDNVTVYENEQGQAVIYFRQKNEYILISVDMA